MTAFIALYNGAGMRVKKTDRRGALGLQVHNYSSSPFGLLHEDNPTTVYTPGFGHRSNGINKFYHTDWLGSTRYTSDITGNGFPAAMRFDAFGNRTATGGTDPYHSTDKQFAGLWEYQTEWSNGASDPGLGLQYLQQRYYDPAVGRFLSPDPISFLGGLNLYAYASDPVGMVDPSGLDEIDDLLAGRARQRARLDRLNQQLAGGLGTGLGVLSAVNPGANAAMVVNEAGEGNFLSAAARLAGGAGKALGAGLAKGAKGLARGAGRAAGRFVRFCRGGPGGRRGVEDLARRAAQVNGLLHPVAQWHRTTAVLQTRAGRIIAGGGRDLEQAQIDALRRGEIAAMLPGAHAEITALEKARQLGVLPEAIGVSRPFCPTCADAIRKSGGIITSPTTAVWPGRR